MGAVVQMGSIEKQPSRRRILIVEDDGVSRQALNRLLDKNGYEPFTVATGGQALSFLNTQTVDLILMDVMLPDIDGLAVATAIRDLERQKNIRRVPIVTVTALALEVQEQFTHITDGYIRKPFVSDEVLSVVQRLTPTTKA